MRLRKNKKKKLISNFDRKIIVIDNIYWNTEKMKLLIHNIASKTYKLININIQIIWKHIKIAKSDIDIMVFF